MQDPVTPDPHDPIEDLVAACIEAIEQGRGDPVPDVCAQLPEQIPRLRRRLAQLAARGLIALPAAAVPTAIGPYRIVRELGSGGMGSVYLAEQTEPVRRSVALKVVKPGMDTHEVLQRFAAERQALALMNHPHIAKVHDAGVTSEGRPYFVMEYVPGQPITVHCREHGLGVEARLVLFAKVCRAVQHAHDRGIIHRDLKPTNVLVEPGDEPLPKVIDFGIAKATSPVDATASSRTRAGQVLGTPEYMSPEQARSGGLDVDIRTDVYSLGVMLYELACSELPFAPERLRRAGTGELERILCDETPPPPSARAATPELRARLRGELDWIAGKALAKERAARYPSALALAEDLERHLRHEPVVAGPPGVRYRVRKLIRRHRLEFAALALVLVALVTGLATSLRFYFAAAHARSEEASAHAGTREFYGHARDAIERMLVRVGTERLLHVPQADQVRRELLEDAVAFYEKLRGVRRQDPELRLEIARAAMALGSIQLQLGRVEDGERALRSAIAAADELLAELPESGEVRRLRAAATFHLSGALRLAGRSEDALAAVRTALAELTALPEERRTAEGAALEARIWNSLALLEAGDPTGVAAALRHALECFAAAIAGSRDPEDRAELEAQHAATRVNLAQHIEVTEGMAAAAGELVATIADLESGPTPPSRSRREALILARSVHAKVLERDGRAEAAEVTQQRAIAEARVLVAEHPDVLPYRERLMRSIAHLGELLDARGALSAAIAAGREEVELCAALLRDGPRSTEPVIAHVRARIRLASRLVRAGDAALLRGSLELLRAALRDAEDLHAAQPGDEKVALLLAEATGCLATALGEDGERGEVFALFARARGALDDVLARNAASGDARQLIVATMSSEARLQLQAGRPVAAASLARAAFRQARAAISAPDRAAAMRSVLPDLASHLARACIAQDDLENAANAAEDLLALAPGAAPARARAAAILGVCAAYAGSETERAPWRERSSSLFLELLRDDEAAPGPTGQRVELRRQLATMLARSGAPAAAVPHFERAQRELEEHGAAAAARASCAAELGDALLATGALAGAERCAEEVAALGATDGATLLGAARLLAACAGAGPADSDRDRRAARALDLLGGALGRGVPRSRVTEDPDLEPLRRLAGCDAVLQRGR